MRLGGCGLTKQSSIAEAACVGSWALVWRPMQQLCPQLFGGVDLATAPQEAFVELQRAHARLMEAHARVAGVWERWDHDIYDYNTDGETELQGLPPRATCEAAGATTYYSIRI